MTPEKRLRDYLAEKAATLEIADAPLPIPAPSIRRSRAGIALFATAAALVLVGLPLLVLSVLSDTSEEVPPVTAQPGSTTTTTLAPTTTVLSTDTATGSKAAGFADVEAALSAAQDRWAGSFIQSYGYLLEVDCDCPDDTKTWVRRWAESAEPQSIRELDGLFARISAALTAEPESIEVSFSAVDGHPAGYRIIDDGTEYSLSVDHFHKIVEAESPYDGSWRFAHGSIDGESFGNPATRGIFLTLEQGRASFPFDCNHAGGAVDIYDGWFGIGSVYATLAGCGEQATESTMFYDSIGRAEEIRLDGEDLILSGPGVELVFASPEAPVEADDLGELPLTAAGQRLSFNAPGQASTNRYIIAQSIEAFGDRVMYLLSAESAESGSVATWEPWTGEPDDMEMVDIGSNPHTIVVPADLQIGDYYLCSPYWEPDPFCFTLRVRLPSAPWIVTAGLDGVVLLDADGTSDVISTEPSAIAFYIDGRFVTQTLSQFDRILIDDSTEILLQPDEKLLDVAFVGGTSIGLVAGPDGSTTIDLETETRIVVGPRALSGRLMDNSAILRTAPDTIEMMDLTGAELWSRTVDPGTLVTPADDGTLHLYRYRLLQSDAGTETYYQYIATEVLDPVTGATLDSHEAEVPIPFEGQHLGEPCGRTEHRSGMLLCPQPDGRIVTHMVDFGDTRTLVDRAITATYVRFDDA